MLEPHLKDVVLKQGIVLQEQGEGVEHVYFPNDGIISLLAVMRQGDAIEIATIGYEGAVGSLSGLGPRRSHTRAVVQVRGTASRIAATRFRQAVEESEAVHSIVVRYGEMLLIQVQQTAACNALHAVEARLSRWLLQARDRLESNTIELTHEFLSQMLGVRRTTVTVVAHMLQQAGLIRYHRGQIEIITGRVSRREPASATRRSVTKWVRSSWRRKTDREAEWAGESASPVELAEGQLSEVIGTEKSWLEQ